MESKQKIIKQLLDDLNILNCNKVNANNGFEEVFGSGKLFSVVCNKCGSTDIEIIGEKGINYGGKTGYQEGSTVVKCNSCGSAITVWE